jgi:DNA-binding MarR family transcriptional regulator
VKTVDLIWLGERLAETGRREMRARHPGVPTIEFIIMRHLIANPPGTITALASQTGYAQSRVSTAVASLVERGWAQTESDAADGRRTLVSAPDHIRLAADTGLQAETAGLDRLLDGYPPARRQAILRALDELLEVLRTEETDDQS